MEYELVDSFDIDGGELDGIPGHLCFVLGVEWGHLYSLGHQGGPIEMTVHAENRSRVEKMLRRLGYCVGFTEMDHGWVRLSADKVPERM